MKSKEKKTYSAVSGKIAQPVTRRSPFLAKQNVLPALFLCLYALVDFVPSFGAADVAGAQWIYLVIINLACIAFMIWERKIDFFSPLKKIGTTLLSALYTGLFIVAGISILFAFNKTESVVCYTRLAISLVTYFNIALLLSGRLDIFRFFAWIFSFLLLVKSAGILIDFFNGYGNTTLDLLVSSLKGNTGNKNIMAASLAIKIPFAFYCLYTGGLPGKIANIFILMFASVAIFLISSRAAYLTLGIEILLFFVFCLLNYFSTKNLRTLLIRTGSVFIPVIISFLLAQSIINSALNMEEKKGGIGTVTERLGTIDFSAKGSGNRVLQWASAIDYIKLHPLTGAGYGNWKLASIPYEKKYVYEKTGGDELNVTVHVHNDFLEIAAETGITGGLLFLAIFICAAVYLVRAIILKYDEGRGEMAAFSLIALAGYCIDAIFNFPMERPVMQFFFIFLLGFCVNIFLSAKKNLDTRTTQKGGIRIVATAVMIIVLIPAFYISTLTYRSLVGQKTCLPDMQSNAFQYSADEVMDFFPGIPNMNFQTIPIDVIKARYFAKEKKYREAMELLDHSNNVNPFLSINEFEKAKIFLEMNKTDSALFYAEKSFYAKPGAGAYWRLLNIVCSRTNDTASISKAFKERIQYKNDTASWNEYLGNMINLPFANEAKLAMADSGLKLFATDSFLIRIKNMVQGGTKSILTISPDRLKEATNYFDQAMEAYLKKDFANALVKFKKAAELNPNSYNPVENIGLCYFSLNNFNEAIKYFDRVILIYKPGDGKSELLKGLSLINLGSKKEGCTYLKMSDEMNNKQAKAQMAIYCQ
jgi:O-antigen ligase/tetratricopeptide (TPR) repeat protein